MEAVILPLIMPPIGRRGVDWAVRVGVDCACAAENSVNSFCKFPSCSSRAFLLVLSSRLSVVSRDSDCCAAWSSYCVLRAVFCWSSYFFTISFWLALVSVSSARIRSEFISRYLIFSTVFWCCIFSEVRDSSRLLTFVACMDRFSFASKREAEVSSLSFTTLSYSCLMVWYLTLSSLSSESFWLSFSVLKRTMFRKMYRWLLVLLSLFSW